MTTIFYRHQKIILATLLFIIVFSGLGLFYGHWGLSTDDWGNLWHTMMAKSWKDFGRYFINIELASQSTNYTSPFDVPRNAQAFFCGLLRPLTFVYYWFEVHIFGLNPYALFLVSAAFHAGSCALLFYIFSAITSSLWAFLAALFFGFHPSLWIWWGFISPQSYYIELFFLLLIFVCLHKFMQTSRITWYLVACILYAHNLLVREQTLFLSLWLMPAFYFYDIMTKATPPKFWANILHYTKLASGFLSITCGYIALRLWLFPLTSNTSTLTFQPTWDSFINRFSTRLPDFITYVANLCALTVLPQNHQIIKGTLIIAIFALLAYLFMHNSRKNLVLFIAASIPLFSWPALLMHHQPRYAYMSFPFSIFLVLLLCAYYQGKTMRIPRLIPATALVIFIAINTCMITSHTLQRQDRMTSVFQAFTALVNNPVTHNRTLYFLGYPPILYTGLAHAIWLLNDDHTIRVHGNNLNIVTPYFTGPKHHYLHYTPTPDGLLCTTSNEQEIAFADTAHTRTSTYFVPIDDLAPEENPLYITWDYDKKRFNILGDATLFGQ